MQSKLHLKNNRLKSIKQILFYNLNIDAAFITNFSNIRYISGFTGDAGVLLLFKRKNFLFTDNRYAIQAEREIHDKIDLKIYKDFGSLYEFIGEQFKKRNVKKVGIEYDNITLSQIEMMRRHHANKIKFADIANSPHGNILLDFRSVKITEEIRYIRKALKIAEDAFRELEIVPGKTELEIASELECAMKKRGAEGISFPTIVAAGKNSALPHYQPSNVKIKKNDVVLIDFGAVYKGYHSDTTRTVFVGNPHPKLLEIYNIVKEEHDLAIEGIKRGMWPHRLDDMVDRNFRRKGYKDGLIHSLGHGVGLDIHEYPVINSRRPAVLYPGMAFTIEPGIYIKGLGGVRIENMVYIQNERYKYTTINNPETGKKERKKALHRRVRVLNTLDY